MGFKTPSECFLYDPVWGCILEVFDDLPVIDHEFYGEKIFGYKDELMQIGVLVDFKDAIKKFAILFDQRHWKLQLTYMLSHFSLLAGC
jgi:sacsin